MPVAFRTSEVTCRRFDPWHYQPLFVEARRMMSAGGACAELAALVDPHRGVSGGATPLGAEYSNVGTVRFYRTGEIADMMIDSERAVFISIEQDEGLARSRLAPGDILLTITGAHFGQSAVVSEQHLPGNISQHSVRFGVKETDAHYLVAFLESRYGQTMIWQQAYGATRPAIDYPSIGSVLIRTPDRDAQLYIGGKVRLAERLRRAAKHLALDFEAYTQAHWPESFGPPQAFGRHGRARPTELNSDLNPGAFNPERVRLRRYLLEHGGRKIGSLAHISAGTTDEYSLDDEYVGLESISTADSTLKPSRVRDAEVEGTVRILTAGPVISKLRPYLNKVSYIPDEMAGIFGSTELLCVNPKEGVSGWYLYGVLKLQSTVRQLQPVATGSTHPRVNRANVLDVVVPWTDEQQRLGDLLRLAQLNYFSATRLTTAAKFLIEALIEGRVTEAEMATAQQALDVGNPAPDRALLARLTRAGFDLPGDPLFSNLEALDAALATAAAETTNQE